MIFVPAKLNVGLLPHSRGAALSVSYQQLTWVWTTDYICELHMLFMSEVSPQISVVTFTCSLHKICLHKICLHKNRWLYWCVPDPFLPATRVKGSKGSGSTRLTSCRVLLLKAIQNDPLWHSINNKLRAKGRGVLVHACNIIWPGKLLPFRLQVKWLSSSRVLDLQLLAVL